jgi:hypothetical protein
VRPLARLYVGTSAPLTEFDGYRLGVVFIIDEHDDDLVVVFVVDDGVRPW